MNLCAPHPSFATPLPVMSGAMPELWLDATRQATDAGLRC